MSYENTPLAVARGLTRVKVQCSPGKIRVVRSSPAPRPSGADGAQEKEAYEDARLSQVILILTRWLRHSDKQGIIRNVLLTEKYRNVRHGNRWHKEAIFDDLHKEIGSLSPLDERWDHGMLIGDFFASEVSWLRDDLIEKQKERRSQEKPPDSPPVWDGDWFLGVPSPLDRSHEFAPNLPETPRAGFTARARRSLESAGFVADMEWGKNGVIITCTLPGTSRDAYELLADYTGEIMSRLRDRLSKYCKRKLKRPPSYGWFSVWEKQSRGALHFHAFLGGSPANFGMDELLIMGKLVTDWWFEILRDIGEENGINMFYNADRDIDWSESPDRWQSDVQPLKKSVARYFSKYASKEAAKQYGATFEGSKDGYPTPKRWWQMNKIIRNLIRTWSGEFEFLSSNPLDISLNEIIHESLQVYPEASHTKYNTECYTNLDTKCYTGINKARTDFWEITKKVKIDTPNGEVEFNKTFSNGITSTYLYSFENYKEVFPQVMAMKSVIGSLAETAQDRMIPWEDRLPPIEKDIPKPLLKWDKDLLRGIDPTDGNTILDFERYWQYEDWKQAQDPIYQDISRQMEREETEYYCEVWGAYLNILSQIGDKSTYDLLFGSSDSPVREIDEWGMITALSESYEAEMAYRTGFDG